MKKETHHLSDIYLYVWKIFLAVFACAGGFVLIWCILDTQHNLPINRMLVLPILLALGLITTLFFVAKKLNSFLEKYHKILFPMFFILYGIFLFGVSSYSRCIPMYDSASVYDIALHMAGLTEDVNWAYLARCSNNIIPTIYLSFLFRLGHLLQLKDVYYVAIFANTIQILLSLYCTFYICKKFSHYSYSAGWTGMLLLATYLPIISHTQSVYTDAFSFCFAIVAFYIWKNNQEKRQFKKRFHAVNLLVGILWGIGGGIKATVLIALVALSLYLLMFKGLKGLLQNALIFVGCLLTMVSLNIYASTLPCEPLKETYGAPTITYFIGIGMEGDGRFTMESEFLNKLYAIEGYENRADWAKQYIWENRDVFVDPGHVLSKVRYNFASGGFKASDFMRKTDNRTIMYECMSDDGIYNYRFYMIFTAYYYMLLLLMVISCVLELFIEKKPEPERFIPPMSMFGIMLYMMLCEANNRQLYNHLPWLICSGSIGLWFLVDKLRAKCKKL